MPENLEFPEYSFLYTKTARSLRLALPGDILPALLEIENSLTEDPDQFPNQTIVLHDDIYVYRHVFPNMEVTYRVDREKKVIYFLHLAVTALEVKKPLFISYSHKDKEWLVQLKKFLVPLEKNDLIKIWDDSEIKAGDNWRDEIEKNLDSAKVVLLLVSQDFLTSEFITDHELPRLLEAAKRKGVKIFWVAVRPSTVEDEEINKYQAVHKDPPLSELSPVEREKELVAIYKKIKQAIN